jgi:hypothetical protein
MGETLKVICQLCDEVVAFTTLDELAFPIRGGMFRSPDVAHGIPAPWQAYEEWEDMRCPYGRIHRAMVANDIIKTNKGMVRLNKYKHPSMAAAYFDLDANVIIDRSNIIDRSIMVPDDQAEAIARREVYGKAETGAGQPQDVQPVEEGKGKEATAVLICETCGASFKSKHALAGHRKAHGKAPG